MCATRLLARLLFLVNGRTFLLTLVACIVVEEISGLQSEGTSIFLEVLDHKLRVVVYDTQVLAFSVAGPTVWNSLPDKLRDPSLSIDSFRRQLKTFLSVD